MPNDSISSESQTEDSYDVLCKQVELGFCGAPYFISEKKYDQRTILDRKIAEQLRVHLPIIARSCDFWTVLYGSNNDGFNLNTLHSLCSERKSQLLVISALPYSQPDPKNAPVLPGPSEVGRNAVFGAFVNEGLRVNQDFYGSSTSFLWKKNILPNQHCGSPLNSGSVVSSFRSATHERLSLVANTEFVTAKGSSPDNDYPSSICQDYYSPPSDESRQDNVYVEVYHATGKDSRYVLSDGSFIALGIGRIGKFGLWLSKHLDYGYTSPSATYGNPSLVDGFPEGSHFRVCSIEVWGVG